ncbi:hypothetical protein Mal15_09370 [Stieleria maiorica]|uniref:Uncharacterized protein n=1 Tax=Stieleria maiorica TaxID=2795974 RepID=A0A5B9MCF6_9BACT|nr:hypothetical protein [Stieleria maiorica]QEF96907.1 hypothetical protein Mal15_09370 [Stieleria maiorica]
MKIKCPGCASLLQIPDSAAGKVVKCKCGKQLRAPAATGAAPKAAAAGATGQSRPAAARPAAQSRPLAAPAPAATAGLFDELTDTDLAPVKAVQVPGAKKAVKPPSANAAKLLNEAISGSDRRGEAMLMKTEAPQPPFLIFIGLINALGAIFYGGLLVLVLGFVDAEMLEEMSGAMGDVVGVVYYIIVGMLGLMAALSLATSICCFIRGKVSWYVVLLSYGWALAFRIFEIIDQATSDDVDFNIIKGVGSLLIGAGIWAWLHGESVRAYYGTEEEPIWRIAVVDSTGFLVAGALGAAALLLG